MKAHVLKGSKQEIAESLVRINGEVHEAIAFEEEAVAPARGPNEPTDIFAEMGPYMVDAREVADSREAIYMRMEGE
jgi:hypothetical protein